jgi:hypothetical protein
VDRSGRGHEKVVKHENYQTQHRFECQVVKMVIVRGALNKNLITCFKMSSILQI